MRGSCSPDQFIDHYRKQNVRIVTDSSIDVNDDDIPQPNDEMPDEQVQLEQKIELFNSLLDDLPHEQREVFLLKEEADMSIAEIAETVGINHEAAKSRLRYAVTKLRKGLADE